MTRVRLLLSPLLPRPQAVRFSCHGPVVTRRGPVDSSDVPSFATLGPDMFSPALLRAPRNLLASRFLARHLQEFVVCNPRLDEFRRVGEYEVSCNFALYLTLAPEVNRRILTALREHPTLQKTCKNVLYKGRNKADEIVTKIFKVRGAVLYSVSQVIIGCLAGYCSHSHLHA